ncbi:MAG TPA: hypothetical protein VFS43_02060 [Polyangiaceae bacterium]|nr:hypothetical protein [Polyangiaceae bacterium]
MRRLLAAASALVVALALFGCESGSSEGDESAASSPSATTDPFDRLPAPIRAFLDNDPEHPFGEPGENAPPENDFFAALVGVWSCRLRFGARYAFPSTWAFKHSAGGFAIEHLYYQREGDLVPPFASLARDFQSLAITLYDPAEEAWKFVGVSNLAGTDIAPASQAMTGLVKDDVLTLEPDTQPDELHTRDTFHDIEADGFVWTQYESRDQGATWTESASIVCQRKI